MTMSEEGLWPAARNLGVHVLLCLLLLSTLYKYGTIHILHNREGFVAGVAKSLHYNINLNVKFN